VALVLEDWDWDMLPKKDGEIWDALLSTVFLGAVVRTAQAAYVKEALGDLIAFDAAKAVPTDPVWRSKVLKVINAKLGSIAGTPGEGFKRAILQIVTHEVENFDLSRTIGTALKFLSAHTVNIQKIKILQVLLDSWTSADIPVSDGQETCQTIGRYLLQLAIACET